MKINLQILQKEKKLQKQVTNKNVKDQDSIKKTVENKATKEDVKESSKIQSNELPKEESKQEVKKAKDWGRASNDPRIKSKILVFLNSFLLIDLR